MSRTGSLASLLSHETRTASTSLLVIGILLGGSAATAAVWWRSKRALPWRRSSLDRSEPATGARPADQFICVLDGLSKPCRRDAIEVASCFGVTDVWVVANADASDLKDDYQQAHTGSVLSSNGQSVTVRIFATAQECCDTLAGDDWMVYMACARQAGRSAEADSNHKKAVVVAVPFPSKPFTLAAQQWATAEDDESSDSKSLPASAALALTLHYLQNGRNSQSVQQDRRDLDSTAAQCNAEPSELQDLTDCGVLDSSAAYHQQTGTANANSTSSNTSNRHSGPGELTESDAPSSAPDSHSEARTADSVLRDAPQSDNHKQSPQEAGTEADETTAPEVLQEQPVPIMQETKSHAEAAADAESGSHKQESGTELDEEPQDSKHTSDTHEAKPAAEDAFQSSDSGSESSNDDSSSNDKGGHPPGAESIGPASPSESHGIDESQEGISSQTPFGAYASPPGTSNTSRVSEAISSALLPTVGSSPGILGVSTGQDASSQAASSLNASAQAAMNGLQAPGASKDLDSSAQAARSASSISASGLSSRDDAASQAAAAQAAKAASKMQATEMSRLQAQAMRRSGVLRRHGMGTSSRASSSMGSPTGSVASVSTSGWPDTPSSK